MGVWWRIKGKGTGGKLAVGSWQVAVGRKRVEDGN